MTVNEAIEQFRTEHLLGEKGREPRTVEDYRRLHLRWFAPEMGRRRVREIDEAAIDRIFGRMRRAGLSRSRMNHAKSLYAPFFRSARRRCLMTRSPMADFELPTSTHASREHTPPEVEQLCLLLEPAVEGVPDVAPLLTLGAVTGMRRGELVTVRRSCQAHFDELTGAGRRLRPRRRTGAARSATKAANRAAAKTRRRRRGAPDTAAVREWARANGYAVSDRGRIPGHILEAFPARA